MPYNRNPGHKTSVRVRALDMRALAAMERHGLREDERGKARRVRDVGPLIVAGLNLRQLFETHVTNARMRADTKRPVAHLLFQFPTHLAVERQQWMLSTAVEFAQRTYGGNAVFAGRLDRDEKGQHVVDVFIAPRYSKATKAGSKDWISTCGKWHARLCDKHRAEIERRMGKFTNSPRAQGMALQSEWIEHLRDKGLLIDDKKEKIPLAPDRLEPEGYAAEQRRRLAMEQEQAQLEDEARAAREARLGEREREVEALRAQARAKLEDAESLLLSAEARKSEIERELEWLNEDKARHLEEIGKLTAARRRQEERTAALEARERRMRKDPVLADRIWDYLRRVEIHEAEQRALEAENRALHGEPEKNSHQKGRKGLGHGD